MAHDHKTRRHWIWLTPVVYLITALYDVWHLLARIISGIVSKFQEIRHPDLKNLKTLAGIRKPKDDTKHDQVLLWYSSGGRITMGVSTNVYVFWGIKLPWRDDLHEAFEEYWAENRESELPNHMFDGMMGEYMYLGVQLFDSGDIRFGLEGGDSHRKTQVDTLLNKEHMYKQTFVKLFPEFASLMDSEFEIHMFTHYY